MAGILPILFVIALSKAAYAAGSWNYYNQEDWGGVCNSGTRQSPINIRTEDLVQGRRTTNLVFSNWGLEVAGELKNNGHTIQFTPFPDNPAITTTNHLGEYRLLQFHMHWGKNDGTGSEHRINGHQADLEIHFVHKRVAASGPDSEKYMVVGVLANAGSNSPESPLIKILPISVMQTYGYRVGAFARMEWFLPVDHSYYHYEGSLTTPTCDETVQWFLIKEPITVPRAVLEDLRSVLTESGAQLKFNYRDIQPLHCRSVYEHDDPGQCYTFLSQPLRSEERPIGGLKDESSKSDNSDNSDRSDRYF